MLKLAYGHEHPLQVTDKWPDTSEENDRNFPELDVENVKARRKGPADGRNPFKRCSAKEKLEEVEKEEGVEEGESVVEAVDRVEVEKGERVKDEGKEEYVVHAQQAHENKWDEVVRAVENVVVPNLYEAQFNCSLDNKAAVEEVVRAAENVFLPNMNVCAMFRRPSEKMTNDLVSFVLRNKEGRAGYSMLRCDDDNATLMNCYRVLEPSEGGVDDHYVRVAAIMYNKIWKAFYHNNGIRCMIDPTIAIRVISQGSAKIDEQKFKRKFKRYKEYAEYKGLSASGFYAVFVPVLENAHWWCAAFSPNTNEVWVMDSLTDCGTEKHKKLLDKLSEAMDLFFSLIDSNWVSGKIISWQRKDVTLTRQCDDNTCGIRMLIAIKKCAQQLQTSCHLHNRIDVERKWLLSEDLMSNYNEDREKIIEETTLGKISPYHIQ